MPTKRKPAGAAPLRLEVVDWLLEGQVRRSDEADPLRATGVYDSFIEFDEPGPDLAAAWRQHQPWLLAEWTRRGGLGQPWATRFDKRSEAGAAR